MVTLLKHDCELRWVKRPGRLVVVVTEDAYIRVRPDADEHGRPTVR